jgi:hypothetical protein
MILNATTMRTARKKFVIAPRDAGRRLSNPDQLNNDADLLGDVCDPDDDNDGLSDIMEASIGTDPFLADTDGDGLNDSIDPDPLTPHMLGDLAPYGSSDGVINAADLMIMQRIVSGSVTPTSQDITRGDLHPAGAPNGIIDLADLLILRQMLLNPGN